MTGSIVLNTDDISEGSNLYFTESRVLSTILTGFTNSSGTVSSTDSILQAIQKLNGNIPNVSISSNVIPKGNGTSIVNGSWQFDNNDITPTTNGSNIGSSSSRIGTIFFSNSTPNIIYTTDLTFSNGTTTKMTLSSNGDLGVGLTPTTYKISAVSNDNADFSAVKLLSANQAQFLELGWAGLNSTYYLKLQSGSGQDITLNAAGGKVGVGIPSPLSKFHVEQTLNDFQYEGRFRNTSSGISAASSIITSTDNSGFEFGQLSSNHTTYSGYGQLGDSFIRSAVGARNINIITDPSNTGKILFWSRLNPTTDATTPSLAINGLSIGIATNVPSARFHIYTDNNDITGQSGQLINNVNAGTSAASVLFFRNNDNKGFEMGVVSSTHTTYQDTYGTASDSFYTSVIGGGNLIFKQRTTGKGIKFFNAGNGVVTGQSLVNISDNGTGFYTDSISAIVHIKGVDSTSGAYGLKIDNSSSPLFYVRNDGNAFMGNNTPSSVASPIALDLGGQYSNTNGLNPKLIIYNNNNTVKAGFGISYNGSGQTEMFTYAGNSSIDYTWYHGQHNLFRINPAEINLVRAINTVGNGSAITLGLLNSANAPTVYAAISSEIIDNTASSEDGALRFKTMTNGFLTEKMSINNTGTISASSLSIYADNASALLGGLSVNDIYKTSTGELRIVI